MKEGERGERMERNVEEESSSCERNRRVKIKLDFAFVEDGIFFNFLIWCTACFHSILERILFNY